MSCCKNFLGDYPHNEDIGTGLIAPVTGKYIVLLDFQGSKIRKEIIVGISDEIVIPGPFNENYNYNFTVANPDGNLLSSNLCTDFGFKTYVSITPNCDGHVCDDIIDLGYS